MGFLAASEGCGGGDGGFAAFAAIVDLGSSLTSAAATLE